MDEAILKSIYHTGFVARDLDKSVDFYTNVMGMSVTRRMEREGEFIYDFNWLEFIEVV